jgi:two-component system sensor histidine kinase DesK
LLALIIAVGAVGTVAIWRSTHGRPLPTAVTFAWAACGLALIYLASRVRARGDPTSFVSFELLAIVALVLIVLGATRELAWSIAFALSSLGAILVGAARIPNVLPLVALMIGAYMVGATSRWLYRVVLELDQSRVELSALRVSEERQRFSRDVHDVVGRALSTIAVKSQLAVALNRRADARAETEMLEVAEVADAALAEARLLARGYRERDLDRELSAARSLLEHMGVGVSAPTSTEAALPTLKEHMAVVLRESITNILRHSKASQVVISIRPHSLTVWNDGAGREPGARSGGTGLQSLSAQLSTVGGAITAMRNGDGFSVKANFRGDAE